MRPLCIYHGNCQDGFTAAWAVWKALGQHAPGEAAVELLAATYQDAPPKVKGRDVILVDFSYKRDVIVKLAGQARSLVILDHHKSAAEDLSEMPKLQPGATWAGFQAGVQAGRDEQTNGGNCAALFDLERSGARIAWEFFVPQQPVPTLVQYVEDRDLWRFALPRSREIAANLFSYEYTLANWENAYWALQGGRVREWMSAGAAIERKHHKDIAELVATTRRRMTIGGHEVWVANLPHTLTSDAANLMAADTGNGGEPFAACYWDTPQGRVFSLRSRPDGADVAEIAKQYGGGGHKHAAGFRVKLDQLGELA